ncbi:MAG TPA: DUF6542 domain-containing protein [Mycobacterium sp.]|nr:DUF6542 domain-containing protein [Mycobacterium sp.]
MSAQRAGSAVAADHRSIHPGLPGLPWWAAVVVALTTTVVGFAFDAESNGKELTNVFAAMYVLGCVAAVLVVRQSGVFTAVIQPPLILFGAVPGAYWLFRGATFTGIKDILINCGYPLIERFPLMLFTSAGVLLIGMGRWYFGMATQAATPKASDETTPAGPARLASIAAKLAAKLTAVLNREPAHAIDTSASRRRRAGDRPGRSTAARGSGKRSAPTRSRHVRPPLGDTAEREADRPRRRRTAPTRGEEPPTLRRPRPPRDFDRRGQPPREARRDPQLRAGRPTARSNPMDSYQPVEPPDRSPRHREASKATNGATHHPISRVRYRRPDPGDQPGAEQPGRPPEPHQGGADSWRYDI